MFRQPIKKIHPNKMAIRSIYIKKIHHFLYFLKEQSQGFFFNKRKKANF